MRVSVVTPAKVDTPDLLKWLEEAVDSVFRQTHEDWEMIVVNDRSRMDLGSSDALKAAFKDKRMRGAKAERAGVVHARNQAASMASGPLLLPLDADDLLVPTAMKDMLGAYKPDTIIYGDTIIFGRDNSRTYHSPEFNMGRLMRELLMPVGSLHAKKDWEKVGGWSPEMEGGLEDWEYWIKMAKAGICPKHLSKLTYRYRRHAASRLTAMRSSNPAAYEASLARMRARHIDLYSGKVDMTPCGGCGGNWVMPKQRPVPPSQVEILATTPTDNMVPVAYIGNQGGGFFITGRMSGLQYYVPGPGELLRTEDGRRGVHQSDVRYLLGIHRGRDFEVRE